MSHELVIFVEGPTLTTVLKDMRRRMDFDRLRHAVAEEMGVHPNGTQIRYYISVLHGGSSKFETFLKRLEEMDIRVVRERPLNTKLHCHKCNAFNQHERPNVVPRMIEDILTGAVDRRYEAAAVLTGRFDFIPCIRAVRTLGPTIEPCFWGRHNLLRQELVEVCPDFIDLNTLDVFQTHRHVSRRDDW